MFSVSRIDELAQKLGFYQEQMTTITEALEALRHAGEMITAGLVVERAALYDLLAEAGPAAKEATETGGVDTSEADVDTEIEAEADAGSDAEVGAAELSSIEDDEQVFASDDEAATSLDFKSGDAAELVTEAIETSETAPFDQLHDVSAVLADDGDCSLISTAGAVEPDAPHAETTVVEATAGEAGIQTEQMIAQIAEAAVAHDAMKDVAQDALPTTNVINLADRRAPSKIGIARPSRRRVVGIVAALLLAVSGTAGVQELLQSETAQSLLGLQACDSAALTSNRDCAMLAWMML